MSGKIDKVKAAESLAEYWGTYAGQHGYADYTDRTFMEDAIYGLGVAINPDEYRFAQGRKRFKDMLREYLVAYPE